MSGQPRHQTKYRHFLHHRQGDIQTEGQTENGWTHEWTHTGQ